MDECKPLIMGYFKSGKAHWVKSGGDLMAAVGKSGRGGVIPNKHSTDVEYPSPRVCMSIHTQIRPKP